MITRQQQQQDHDDNDMVARELKVLVGVLRRRVHDLEYHWFTRRFFSPACFYLHIVVYILWMAAVEHSPWQRFLTYISIEAVLVALLIGIGQQALADRQGMIADLDHQILNCLHISPATDPCTCHSSTIKETP